MVSNASFLPTTLTASTPPSGVTTKKKTKKKSIRRSVSFTEDAPVVTEIDSVRSLLDKEEDVDQLWYDSTEVATLKESNAQLIQDQEDELSVVDDPPDTAELERKLGDSLRGLERQTEEGSWAHFQNRAKALGAVLDSKPDDADDLASLATEATEEARTEAHKRALQDEKEAQAYLSDVRDSLHNSLHKTICFTTRDDDDDDSVLTTNYDDDDESITSEFTNNNNEEDDAEFQFGLDDDDDHKDEPVPDNKFSNVKIEGSLSMKERIKQMNSKATAPPFQAATSTKKTKPAVKRTSTAPSKLLDSSDNKTEESKKKEAKLFPKENTTNKSLTKNKSENNELKNKEAKLLNDTKKKRASLSLKAQGSFSALSIAGDDDEDEIDDVDFCPVAGNKSESSLSMMRNMAQQKKRLSKTTQPDAAAPTKRVSAPTKTAAPAPPTLKASSSMGSLRAAAKSASKKLIDRDEEEDDKPADFDADAKAAIMAIKKTRKKIRRSKTAPKSLDLNASCPLLTMKEGLASEKKETKRRVSKRSSSSKSLLKNSEDEDEAKAARRAARRSSSSKSLLKDGDKEAKPKKRISRSKSSGSVGLKKSEPAGLMGGALGMLIADSAQPEPTTEKPKRKSTKSSSSSDEESDDGGTSTKSSQSRRHTMTGALGSLMSGLDANNEEEPPPKQRASTGGLGGEKKKIRRSKSTSGTSTRTTPSRSKSAPLKKMLLPSNDSRGVEKAKLPSNGSRTSLARVPRRKASTTEEAPSKKTAMRRSSSLL